MSQLTRFNAFKQIANRVFFPTITSVRNCSSSSASTAKNEAGQDPDEPKFEMQNPFEKEKQQCILCKLKIVPDYKNVKLLSQFQSPYTGRIYGRHITGLCKAKQEQVEAEIVKAQTSAMMGYYTKEPCFLKDPKLFNPEHPIRPHRY